MRSKLDVSTVKSYLLFKPESAECYPFDETTAVFKVQGKIFALLSKHQGRPLINLKCNPDHAIELRDIFTEIFPAYHMNKRHWNTVILNGTVPQGEIERMIDNSFKLVIDVMPKSLQQSLLAQIG